MKRLNSQGAGTAEILSPTGQGQYSDKGTSTQITNYITFSLACNKNLYSFLNKALDFGSTLSVGLVFVCFFSILPL